MINSLSQRNDIVEGIVFLVFIVDFLFIMAFYFYNKPKYKTIVSLYEKEIGPIPVTAMQSQWGGLFNAPSVYLSKISFITETLLLPYNRVSNHGMTKEGYLFIRGLPNKLTLGFKIEACLWILCIPLLIYLFVIR